MSTQEGQELAKKNGLLFIETSALKDNNVTEAFSKVGSVILRKLKQNVIDPAIEEYGVKKTGKRVADLNQYDQLLQKSQKKKKKNCKC